MNKNTVVSNIIPLLAVASTLTSFLLQNDQSVTPGPMPKASESKEGLPCASNPLNAIPPCGYNDPIIMQFPVEPNGVYTLTCRNLPSPPAPGSVYDGWNCSYFICENTNVCASDSSMRRKITRIRQVWKKTHSDPNQIPNYYSGPHSDVVQPNCCLCSMDAVTPIVN
jgi:hypothetical protein